MVECETSDAVSKAGIIYINPNTNLGYMEIMLNPANTDENASIINQTPLTIEENLINENVIIESGVYI